MSNQKNFTSKMLGCNGIMIVNSSNANARKAIPIS